MFYLLLPIYLTMGGTVKTNHVIQILIPFIFSIAGCTLHSQISPLDSLSGDASNSLTSKILFSNLTINEGQDLKLKIAIEQGQTSEFTLNYATEDITAVAGTNYTNTSGSITFQPGQTEKEITVKTTGNAAELCGPDRTFKVLIKSKDNSKSFEPATVTITDPDLPSLTLTDITGAEGTNLSFVASLNSTCSKDVNFNYITNNNTAVSGVDYVSSQGTATIGAGSLSTNIVISTIDNPSYVSGVNFNLVLSNAQNVNLVTTSAVGTIYDTDGTLSVESLANGSGVQVTTLSLFTGDNYNVFAILRDSSNAFMSNDAVTWNLTGGVGSVTPSGDFKSATISLTTVGTGTLTITASGRTKSYTLNVIAPPSLVISSTKITPNTSFSYVDLDVDWTRSLAYMASRFTNTCIDTADFSNTSSVTKVKTIGSASLTVCLGVELIDNGTKLLMSSNSSRKLALWDLTANPTTYASWYSMGEYSLGTLNGKRFAKVESPSANQWDIFAVTNAGASRISLSVSGAIGTFTPVSSYTAGSGFNGGTVIGNKILLQSSNGSSDPILTFDSNFSLLSSDPASFWGWSAAKNASGTKAFVGGNGFSFYHNNAGTVSLKKKYLSDGHTIRSASFVVSGPNEYLYTLTSYGTIDVFDVTDMNNISRVKTGILTSFEIEAYGIKIKPDSSLGVVVTNKGDFLVINPAALNNTSVQYTIDP